MKEIAKILLDIKAVFLNVKEPYKWSSGIISPIYCDNRIILSHVKARNKIELELKKVIQKNFKDIEAVVGTATAGIPHAAYLSHLLKIPMGYVRASVKDHGRNKIVEGGLTAKTKVVVIEDLISTARSVLNVVENLRKEKINVLGLVSIFTYEMNDANEKFKKLKIPALSLTNYGELIEVALKEKYIEPDELEKLKKWKKDPWSTEWMK